MLESHSFVHCSIGTNLNSGRARTGRASSVSIRIGKCASMPSSVPVWMLIPLLHDTVPNPVNEIPVWCVLDPLLVQRTIPEWIIMVE